MSLIQFKLKKADASTRHANFPKNPSWGNLASVISLLFDVPLDRVGVAFIDEDKNARSLANEQELQSFYDSLDHSPGVFKFVVQDLTAPDGECTFLFISHWPVVIFLSPGCLALRICSHHFPALLSWSSS
jgi:hypothetical protein